MFSKKTFDISGTINRMADLQTENALLKRDLYAVQKKNMALDIDLSKRKIYERQMKEQHRRELAHARVQEHVEMWDEENSLDASLFEIQVPREIFSDLNLGFMGRMRLGVANSYHHSIYGTFALTPVDGNKIRIVMREHDCTEHEQRSE